MDPKAKEVTVEEEGDSKQRRSPDIIFWVFADEDTIVVACCYSGTTLASLYLQQEFPATWGTWV